METIQSLLQTIVQEDRLELASILADAMEEMGFGDPGLSAVRNSSVADYKKEITHEETACWGIFGLSSGFCYGLYATEKEANKVLAADTRDRVANDRRITKECYYL